MTKMSGRDMKMKLMSVLLVLDLQVYQRLFAYDKWQMKPV
jgi:hypothetical protein